MALTTPELLTVSWQWDQGGQEWGFDPRRTSLPHSDETAARNALSSSEIDTIVLAHKWKVVRKKRDDLLIACDWTQGADVPVGILLSGGLDSSLITAIASKHQKKLKTFTVTFPGEPKFNEKKHANLIADHFNTEHFELSADSIKHEIVNELTQYYDEPLGDPSMIPTYLISKLVKRHCKVVLVGD